MIIVRLFVSAVLAVTALTASAQVPIQVVASGVHYGGRIIYRYDVSNRSSMPLHRIVIGQRLPDQTDGELQLSEPPAAPPTLSFWLPDDAAGRPAGWGAKLVFADGSDRFAIEWVDGNFYRRRSPGAPVDLENAPPATGLPQPIAAGQSTNSLFVAVDRVDPSYVTGHATVNIGDSVFTVLITKADASPPEIALSANRLNANEARGEWALFNLKAAVTDNVDPAPELVMDPVVANSALAPGDFSVEKNGNHVWNVRLRNVPGRKYTIVFRALDASGNSSMRSFIYDVPSR